MLHRTLYKQDSKGKVREWRIEQEGNRYRTIAGLADGEQVTSGWTEVQGKNTGRANETTPEEQATAEIESKYTKKLKVDYHETLSTIAEAKIYKPMLAQSWEKRADKIDFLKGVYVQPKLDGIRCIANKDGLWTRTGKPITAVPHIFDFLAPIFELYPDAVFDGELYNHELKHDFNEIISIVRRAKSSPEDLQKAREMAQYHVYDCPSVDGNFNARFNHLRDLVETAQNKNTDIDLHRAVQLVPTTIEYERIGVDERYGEYMEAGYEGGMVRIDAPYEQKRSNTLIKRKDFEDEEFPIVEIMEGNGNWAGYAKKLTFRLPEPVYIESADTWVDTCGAGIAGSKEFLKEVMANPSNYTVATIQYFTKTPAGMPRFPIAKVLYKGDRDI